jgi:serine/threonine protein kinase
MPDRLAYLAGSAVTASERAEGPGVPSTEGVIELIRAEYRRHDELKRFEEALRADPNNRYQAAFRFLLRTRDQDVANTVIRRAVCRARIPSERFPNLPTDLSDPSSCRSLEEDLDGWYLPPAVEALGQAITHTPATARSIVLTSNFDPLISISVRRAGGIARTVALQSDGSFSGLDGHGCLVVHFHGDWFRSDTLHTQNQLNQDRPKLSASLAQLISTRTLVVIGHSGRDDIFIRTLLGAVRGGLAQLKIAWTFHPKNEAEIFEKSSSLLEALRPGIEMGRVTLYCGVDAHTFLPRFARQLAETSEEAGRLPSPSSTIASGVSFSFQTKAENFQISRTSAQTPAPRLSDEPTYENEEIRAIANQLARAYVRRNALRDARANVTEVEHEILNLRRLLRDGGQLRAGDTIEEDRYLLLHQIGRGGFASVWAALDRGTGEQVAIKVLHPDLARDKSRRERFFRGARVMAELRHDAVVRVLTAHGEDGGYFYFVMELVRGEDLHRAVVGGRFRKEETFALILRIGNALAAGHSKGVVHRDVKPANILLDADSMPWLTDFDLVAAIDTTGGTRTGALGTILFTAPEQIRSAKEANARADVYSLGMTMIFCLHGAELPAIAIRRPEKVIESLDCSDGVKQVIARSIELDPQDRHSDARGFCEALLHAMTSENLNAQDERVSDTAIDPSPEKALDEEASRITSTIVRISAIDSYLNKVPQTNDESLLKTLKLKTDTFRRFAKRDPGTFLPQLANVLSALGVQLQRLKCEEDAVTTLRESVEVRRELAVRDPSVFLRGLASSLNHLGTQYWDLQKSDEALQAFQEAIGIRRELAQIDSDNCLPDLAIDLTDLGARLRKFGQSKEAVECFREAIASYRALSQASPDVYLPSLALRLDELGSLLEEEQTEDALLQFSEVVEVYHTLALRDHSAFLPHLVSSHNKLGTYLSKLGRSEEALKSFEEASELKRVFERYERDT